MYRIIDIQTKTQVGRVYNENERKLASRKANKLDLQYGSIRYIVAIDFTVNGRQPTLDELFPF